MTQRPTNLARAPSRPTLGDLAAAEAAYREAADGGDAASAFQLGVLLNDRGDREGAAQAYQQAADAGDREAALNLAILFADHLNRPADAVRLRKHAAAAGDRRAMLDLALHLWDRDDRGGARDALQQLAAAGEPRALLLIGLSLAEEGERDAAIDAFQAAASAGIEEAYTEIGWQLVSMGRTNEAEGALRRAYDAGELAAAAILQRVLKSQEKDREAESLAVESSERARSDVRLEYRELLSDLDGEGLKEDELSNWAEEEFSKDVPRELVALAFDAPRLAEAITRLKLAVEYGDEEAAVKLGRLSELTGRRGLADRLQREPAVEDA